MRGTLFWAVIALAAAAPRATAFDPDFHFHATYVLAREAGIAEAEALEIAGGAFAVDTARAGILSSIRPLLRAAVIAVGLPTLVWPIVFAIAGEYDSFADWFGKLSDFVLSPAAVAVHFPTTPGADRVVPYAGQPGHQAGRLVEHAIETRDPVLLGIALHAVQDSYSHGGMLPASHLGTMFLVDTLTSPTSRNRARGALWQTWRVLTAWSGVPDATGRWPAVRERLDDWFRRLREEDVSGWRRIEILHGNGVPLPEAAVPEGFEAARERVGRFVAANP